VNKSILAISVAIALSSSLTACMSSITTDNTQAVSATTKSSAIEKQKLDALLKQYFAEFLSRDPIEATSVGEHKYNDQFTAPISKEKLQQDEAFHKKYLAKINEIDVDLLKGQGLLSYQVFKRDREIALKGLMFPQHYIPFNQMYGIHNDFAVLGSGSGSQPFNTVKDFNDFSKRAEGFTQYMQSAVVSMREGVKHNVVLPKAIIKKLIPQFEVHLVNNVKDSVFYQPIATLTNNSVLSSQEKAQISKNDTAMIEQVIIPAYRDTLNFLVNEYEKSGSDTVGLSDLPNGKAWYDHMISVHTTLPLTSDDIHHYGQQEVARILSEMKKVKHTVGFEGNMAEFFVFLKTDSQFYFDTPEQVVAAYEGVKDNINSRLGQLFEVFPKADYEVRQVEAFRAASAPGASYESPAPDGSRSGIFYINTHNLKAQPNFIMETLSIHEASPGHHFQASIQQEVESLPQFRKFGNFTVYEEGWALYAESLGKEMGLFSDPYQWYGRLVDEQLRAMRLVVDTGLHAKGWTREQAIAFMTENSSMADSDIESEVERYISIPGQALAYKTGQRAIRAMRNKSQEALGDKFDIKKFHTQILIDASLPMPILSDKIDRWIATQL